MKSPAQKRPTGRAYLLILGGVLIVTAAIVTWMVWPRGPAGRADPNDAGQVVRGGVVYRQYCASCHGAKLEGQPEWRIRKPDGKLPAPPHDETGHTWHHPDADLFLLTKHGLRPPLAPDGYKSDMPAFDGTLTDEDIWAVLAFIKNSWPPRIRDLQRARDEAARRR
jgi:mono/diheme cytochrome c family protein